MGNEDKNQHVIMSESSKESAQSCHQNSISDGIYITKGLTLLLPSRKSTKNYKDLMDFLESRPHLNQNNAGGFDHVLHPILDSSSSKQQLQSDENPNPISPPFSQEHVFPNPTQTSAVTNKISNKNPLSTDPVSKEMDDYSLSFIMKNVKKDCSYNPVDSGGLIVRASSFQIPDTQYTHPEPNPTLKGSQSRAGNPVGGVVIGADNGPSNRGQQVLPQQNLESQGLNVFPPKVSDPKGKAPMVTSFVMKNAPSSLGSPALSPLLTRSTSSGGPIRTKDMATPTRHYGQWTPGYQRSSSYSGPLENYRSFSGGQVAPYHNRSYYRPSRSMSSQPWPSTPQSGVEVRDGARQPQEHLGNFCTLNPPPEKGTYSAAEYGSRQLPQSGQMLPPPAYQTPTNAGTSIFERTSNQWGAKGVSAADQRSKNLALIQEKKIEIIDVEEYKEKKLYDATNYLIDIEEYALQKLGDATQNLENKTDAEMAGAAGDQIQVETTTTGTMEAAENSGFASEEAGEEGFEFLNWPEYQYLMSFDRFGFDI